MNTEALHILPQTQLWTKSFSLIDGPFLPLMLQVVLIDARAQNTPT